LTPLPIDAAIPAIIKAVEAEGAVVIEAPPGAGKTTRVPSAMLDAHLLGSGEIWVLEPRRLPARLAAARVAAERGEPVGETVGYSVRFDEAGGPRTRLRFMTEGLFVRRLLADPALRGVSAVVLDELHERHVATDLALAWLRRLREGIRPELAVVAMSATLESEEVRAFLAGDTRRATTVRSEGRRFEVAIEHLPVAQASDDRPLERRIAGAVRQLLREEPDGDLLVFLPGAGEIRRAQAALAELPQAAELAILPLHGEMPLEEQTRAVRPAGRRKVVLATNVAESSVTIDGVVAVVDAGLARVAAHSPWTGLPTLALARISRAAADQRAGRAGRTRPGRALRLYTQHDYDQRPAYDPPEIARVDLTDMAMTLGALGVADADALSWLEPPPAASWGAARELLRRLGAISGSGDLTEVGRRMLRYPIHPRLARLVVEGEARGAGQAAVLAASLIGERDIRASARASFGGGGAGARPDRSADITDLVDLYREAEAGRFRPELLRRLELDGRAIEEVGRVRRQLGSALDGRRAPIDAAAETQALRLAILAAFPDRVARRREAGGKVALLAAGGSAELGLEQTGDWLVAVDVVEDRKSGRSGTSGRTPVVRLSSRIEPDWVLDLFGESVVEIDRRAFDPHTERVERTTGLGFGALSLDARTEPAPPDEQTARLLAAAALARGIDKLPGGEAIPALLQRITFAREAAPEAPLPALGADAVSELVRLACVGRNSFAELAMPGADLGSAVLAALPHEARRALDTLAPVHITLPGGRTVPVHYDPASPPWIESRLQDFFGIRAAPAIGGGRVPLTVHLLAPNGRAVQVTRDLAGFWTQHYPALRRELGRRYPRHPWPEDGATARSPAPTANRRR
jgi:ATP-dependent helicase HrpB